MKRIIFALTTVLLLSGCAAPKSTAETQHATTELQQELGAAQYSRQDIRKMIDDGLSLEELSKKLATIYDVQQYILEADILFAGSDIKQRNDGTLWHFSDSPEVVLQKKQGTCGSGSNLIHYLLRGKPQRPHFQLFPQW